MTDAVQAPPLTDFPKLECPFVRKTFRINAADFKQQRAKYGLRAPEVRLVIDEVNPGYEWVFTDPDTVAVEKLNGTNVKLMVTAGRLLTVQNRKNLIDPLAILTHNSYLMEGIHQAAARGYILPDGEQAGELIGPKLQGNPYRLEQHLWYPFRKAVHDLAYRSFHEHDRTFANWSGWFREGLRSRFFAKRAAKAVTNETIFAEGIVFHNLKRQEQGLVSMAKLRRDMFAWYYNGMVENHAGCGDA